MKIFVHFYMEKKKKNILDSSIRIYKASLTIYSQSPQCWILEHAYVPLINFTCQIYNLQASFLYQPEIHFLVICCCYNITNCRIQISMSALVVSISCNKLRILVRDLNESNFIEQGLILIFLFVTCFLPHSLTQTCMPRGWQARSNY